MFALSLAAGARVIYATAVTPGAPAGFGAGISPAKYLLVQGHVILRYLQLLAVPYGFTVDPEISPAQWLAAGAWILLLAAVVKELRALGRCTLGSTVLTGHAPALLWHWSRGFRLPCGD